MSAQDPINGARYTTAWPRHRGFNHKKANRNVSTYDETRTTADCDSCGWTSSGSYWRLEDRADEHEAENPSHTVRIKEPK